MYSILHIRIIKIAVLIAVLAEMLMAADVPRVINYQGKLFFNGTPVDTTVNIKYTLFNTPTGGTPLWEQNSDSVNVKEGLFSDTLGLRIDTVIARYQELWLEISVNGVALTPRERLYAAPYAITVADSAINDQKILWGDSTGVAAEDIPCSPVPDYLNADNVQDALEEISKSGGDAGAPACSSSSYKLYTNY